MINQEELTNILERKDQLAKFLDIKTKKEKLDLLDSKMIQNNFWDNPKEAEKCQKRMRKQTIDDKTQEHALKQGRQTPRASNCKRDTAASITG